MRAPHALPGFARATVDGFAVRAADTYGVSEGQPGYLDLAGEARMGRPPDTALRPGAAIAIATGAPLPPGADAVVKVEHTQSTLPGLIEVVRRGHAGRGDGARRRGRCGRTTELARPGRPLRAADLGMLAAAGVAELRVRARPRVAVVSTGDELVPRETPELETGQVRDATAPALAALVREAGGQPEFAGIVPDDRDALEATLRRSRRGLPTSSSSRRARRWARATRPPPAIASLGEPGIWCHGLALRPGKPTLLADCGGVPVIGLPGNPRSALVVFRLVGMPLVRLVGGCTEPPPEPSAARAARPRPSLGRGPPRRRAGQPRRRRGHPAVRIVGPALDPRARRRLPDRARGRDRAAGGRRGRGRALPLTTQVAPFVHDVPAAEALAAWIDACREAGCPERVEPVRVPLDEAVGRVTAEPVWARRSSPPFDAAAMDGIAVRAADTLGAGETSPVRLEPGRYEVVDTGDPMPRRPRRRRDARGGALGARRGPGGRRRAAGRGRSLPARPLDRRGRQRDRAAAAGGASPAPGGRGRGGRGGNDRAGRCAGRRSWP